MRSYSFDLVNTRLSNVQVTGGAVFSSAGIVWMGGEYAHQKPLELVVGNARLAKNPAADLIETPDTARCWDHLESGDEQSMIVLMRMVRKAG